MAIYGYARVQRMTKARQSKDRPCCNCSAALRRKERHSDCSHPEYQPRKCIPNREGDAGGSLVASSSVLLLTTRSFFFRDFRDIGLAEAARWGFKNVLSFSYFAAASQALGRLSSAYRRRLGRYYLWQFFIHLPLQIPEEGLTNDRRTMEFVLKRKVSKPFL